MKRKSLVSLMLVAVMTVMTVVPALARNITEDTTLTDEDSTEESLDLQGDYTLTIAENNNVSVGGVNGNGYDVTINGSGNLTVDKTDSEDFRAAINGNNVTIEDANVEVNSNCGGINAVGELNITNSDVTVNTTGNASGIEGNEGVNIDNSKVNASAEHGHAIVSYGGGDINIENDSEVSASSSETFAICAEAGNVIVDEGLSIKTPEGGKTGHPYEGEPCSSIMDANGNPAKNVVIGKTTAPEEEQQQPEQPTEEQIQPLVPEDIVVPSEPCDDSNKDAGKDDKKPESSSSGGDSAPQEKETFSNSNPNATASAAVVVPPVYVTADPTTNGETAYVASVTASIANARYGGTVKLTTGDAAFINRSIIDALETRSDVALEISVLYGGVPYVIHIPAGFKLRELLGSDGKIDMNKLISMFGVQL